MSPDEELLLNDWFRRARESQRVHYDCAIHFNRLHLLLGIPAIVLSTVVGTTVFATLQKQASGKAIIFTGMLSVGAAALASLQTFMAYSTRAARHHSTGSHYGAIRRDLELLKTFPGDDASTLEARFAEIKKRMDSLAETAPYVPSWLKRKVDRALESGAYRRVIVPPLSR